MFESLLPIIFVVYPEVELLDHVGKSVFNFLRNLYAIRFNPCGEHCKRGNINIPSPSPFILNPFPAPVIPALKYVSKPCACLYLHCHHLSLIILISFSGTMQQPSNWFPASILILFHPLSSQWSAFSQRPKGKWTYVFPRVKILLLLPHAFKLAFKSFSWPVRSCISWVCPHPPPPLG